MKIRLGFVSNSSSSSFICDVCGRVESGWDMNIEDAQMIQCENGHTIGEEHFEDIDIDELCKEHIMKDPEYTKEELEDEELMYDLIRDMRYSMPESICPICQLKVVTNETTLEYALRLLEQDKEDLDKEIQEKFKTLKEFDNG